MNVTAAAGAPLTLGPIVVKNLDVDIIFANGSWCQYVGGDVKCCPFDMELSLDRNGTVSTIPCVGEMEEWSLLRALDCENGFVEYRLFKRDVRTSDSGEYVYTIANRYHTFNSTTVVDVFPTAAAPSPLTLEVGVIIAVVVTFLICFAVFLIILVGCVVGLWRRRAERGQEQLLQEEVAQQGVVREPVQGAGVCGMWRMRPVQCAKFYIQLLGISLKTHQSVVTVLRFLAACTVIGYPAFQMAMLLD